MHVLLETDLDSRRKQQSLLKLLAIVDGVKLKLFRSDYINKVHAITNFVFD